MRLLKRDRLSARTSLSRQEPQLANVAFLDRMELTGRMASALMPFGLANAHFFDKPARGGRR